MLIPGSQLTPDQRKRVLATFVHRLTRDNECKHVVATGRCLNCNGPYSACAGNCTSAWMERDEDWLASRAFHFARSGRLSEHSPCYTMAEYATKWNAERDKG